MRSFFTKCLLLCSLIGFTNLSSQTYLPTVEGKITDTIGPLKGVVVQVFKGSTLIKKTKTDSLGRYTLTFKPNAVYVVSLSKTTYVTKRYELSTIAVDNARLKDPINKISAETGLRKKVKGVNYSMYKKPMIKFFYDKENDKFDYDKVHLSEMLSAQDKVIEAENKALEQKK